MRPEHWIYTIPLRLRSLFRRREADQELDEELRYHIECKTEEYIVRGMTPQEARRAALLEMGGVEKRKEECRDTRRVNWIQDLLQDARYGLRTMRKSPAFTIVAILTLALGIGATSAVFSAVDRILFRSLPYPQDDRLVSFGLKVPITTDEIMLAMDYIEWRRAASPFAQMASMIPGEKNYDLTEPNPIRVTFAKVDSHFLSTFGIQPILGRNFTPEEDRPHVPRVALLSYGLWRSRYGADPKTVGRSVSLDGQPTRIIGVLPADFEMPTLARVDLLIPEALDEAGMTRGKPQLVLRAFARLKPGVTIAQSRAALQPLFNETMKFYPSFKEVNLSVRSLRERQMGDARLASMVLLASALALLLLASTNVANLLLARAAVRQRETAVRVALGATKARLARQAVTESMLLSLAGAVVGCWVAYGLLRLFVSIAPQGIPRLQQATIDLRVLLFTLTVALVSSLVFGLAPVWRHPDPEILTGKDAQPISRSPLRQILVTSQIAISLVLLTGASLLLRSLWKLQSVPLGMDAQNLVTAEIILGPYKYPHEVQQRAFFEQLQTRLKQIPGINSLALSNSVPPSGEMPATAYSNIEIAGRPRTPQGTGGMVAFREVTPDYFSTLETKILEGPGFRDDDLLPGEKVVILSDSLARRLFPNGDALGERMRFDVDGSWRTIVGVAADVKNNGVEQQSDPEFYIPWKDDPEEYFGLGYIIVRTPVNPDAVAKWIRSEVASIDPAQPVNIQTMSQRVSKLADRPRFNAVLLTLFALMGVCLAAIGMYGVVGFFVAQRTHEIGVRMALGATPRDILRLVFGSVARWTLAGALLGVAGSWFMARMLRTLIFQVSPHDPWLFCGAVLLLVSIAFVAGWIPARRAMRVDPMVALRHE
jgi:putative ABC transport system permease protein